MCQVSSWRTNQTYFHVLWSPSSPDFHLSTHPHWMVFLSKSPVCSSTRLSVFLCCRTISVQQSYFPCFLLHKTSVEYTRFYSAITEMLLYTVEPRMSYYDVFSKCCSVVVLYRTLLAYEFYWNCTHHLFSSYFLLFNMNNTYRSITQHHLLICTYHHHSCPTQQPFYEVEIIYFPVIFITQQTIYDVGVIKRSASVLNNNFTK